MSRRDRAAPLRGGTVQMRHPKVGKEYRAPRSAVAFWEKRGWKRVDAEPAARTTKAVATFGGEKGGE